MPPFETHEYRPPPPHADAPPAMGTLDIFLTGRFHMRFIDTMPVLQRAHDAVKEGIALDAYHAVILKFTEGAALVRIDQINAIVLRED